MREVQVSRIDFSTQKMEQRGDFVAEEVPLHIFLNQVHYVTILCSPYELKELSVGHLLSEGVLKSINEVEEIRLEAGKCRIRSKLGINIQKRISVSQPFSRLIVSACGSPNYWPLPKLIDRLGLLESPLGVTIEAGIILESVRRLNTLAETFKKTGGVHIAALFSADGELLAYSEDVGRHNAVDKVIGSGAFWKIDFKSCFLASSGRLTGDIVLKAARMRIPVIASMAAAISSGVEVAQRMGMTLIGFVRGKRMSIYTHPERVVYTP